MTNKCAIARNAAAIVLAGGMAGCGGTPETIDYDLVTTSVAPIEYARILCQLVPMEDRHTCMTSVMQHYQETKHDDLEPDQVTGGPFVLIFDRRLYRGRYLSQPFAAAFSARDGAGTTCRGRYNAFAGDERAVFDVRCDNGGRGSANIILDTDGRNGIGRLRMDDGSEGDIVFGHAAVGGDFY